MSRTYRNIKATILFFKNNSFKETLITVDTYNKNRNFLWSDDPLLNRKMFKLYCDDGKLTFKYYRKFEEQQYRTYMKRYLKKALRDEYSNDAIIPHTKLVGGY